MFFLLVLGGGTGEWIVCVAESLAEVWVAISVVLDDLCERAGAVL